jgi:methylase of polypeptide subunit release factors
MLSSDRDDKIWQSASIVAQYLSGVSAAIPYKPDQLDVMVRMVEANGVKPTDALRFLDIGCGDGVLSATLLSRFPQSKGALRRWTFSASGCAKSALRMWIVSLEYSNWPYLADGNGHKLHNGLRY